MADDLSTSQVLGYSRYLGNVGIQSLTQRYTQELSSHDIVQKQSLCLPNYAFAVLDHTSLQADHAEFTHESR